MQDSNFTAPTIWHYAQHLLSMWQDVEVILDSFEVLHNTNHNAVLFQLKKYIPNKDIQ